MIKKTIDKIVKKFAQWGKIRVLPVLILLFFFLGLGLLSSISMRVAFYIAIYWVCSGITSRSKWLLERFTLANIEISSTVLAIFFTGWIFLIQVSIFPDNVNLKFDRMFTTRHSFPGSNASELSDATINYIRNNLENLPKDYRENPLEEEIFLGDSTVSSTLNVVGNIAYVQVTAIPKPKRVFILSHPYNTQFWYVQTPLTFVDTDKNDYWEGYIYFGPLNGDCNLKFDLILLGSKDWLWLDVFRGRGLRAGMELDYLPVLNQSETITVQKMCGEK